MEQFVTNIDDEPKKQQIARCTFYNKKKNRKCNLEVYKSSNEQKTYQDYEFCIFHLPNDLQNNEYVDCPIDPSHQVLKSKLKKHEKICNKVKVQKSLEQNPFFLPGVNIQNPPQSNEKKSLRLQEMFQNKSPILQSFIESVSKFFAAAILLYETNQNNFMNIKESLQIQQNLASQDKTQSEIEKYLLDEDDLVIQNDHSYNEKDLLQVDLLVETLRKQKLVNSSFCYIEYGAGKGRFTHGIAQAIVQDFGSDKACHVLIERESRRLKFDRLEQILYSRFHRGNPYFLRLRMDITDFNLPSLREQLPKAYFELSDKLKYVGVCKHMCGGATDLTIQSLVSSNSESNQFTGLICATCCHHLCDRKTYVNIPYLTQIGMNDEQIDLLFACSSWGVSGQIQKKIKPTDSQENDFFTTIGTQQKYQIGKMAKRIIDIGRLLYITQFKDVQVQLLKYCDSLLSPENFVLSVVAIQGQT